MLSINRVLQPVTLPVPGGVETGLTGRTPGEPRLWITRPGKSQFVDTDVLDVSRTSFPCVQPKRKQPSTKDSDQCGSS